MVLPFTYSPPHAPEPPQNHMEPKENQKGDHPGAMVVPSDDNPATPADILLTLQMFFGAGAITFEEYLARKKELMGHA